ncbi:MAG: hypothetical protein A2233_04875 [Candidatus Kerfeldbacteria bacterium RIFOXYA2_FULL_38_24]|uniref:Outer membrane protein beta-barrel domain-containing protein n=1 Tax=Candidatus Kerfeldbacteria bacterium RIFOXYB2_FULL_38_14 TaxID=1798547 RepID=A0A1G2BFL3_9BACT|nr:MAG: hypothetical protein A2319_02205 [Candidatus Kerfeldbacteria bacterium RIFOXYB2_FULL_38_14]OGY88204.1 MAG: hypothetical protein A2233_04875 [Candidatus Kerfeldbacteria bacterium RIFOXYA2_FULL_38_24]
MKRAIVLVSVFLSLFATAGHAQAQGHDVHLTAEVYTSTGQEGVALPTVDLYVSVGMPGASVGGFGWALVAPAGWAEAYGGATLAPTENLELGIGVGFEQAATPLRGAASLFAAKGRLSVFAVGEYGGSGGWYRAQAMGQVAPGLKLGLASRAGKGSGGRMEVVNGSFTIWVEPLLDHTALRERRLEPRLLVGIKARW